MQALKAAAILGQSPAAAGKEGSISTPERPSLAGLDSAGKNGDSAAQSSNNANSAKSGEGKAGQSGAGKGSSEGIRKAESELAAMTARAQRLLDQANGDKGIEMAGSDGTAGGAGQGAGKSSSKAGVGGGFGGEKDTPKYPYPVTNTPIGEVGNVAPAVPNLSTDKVIVGHQLGATAGGVASGKWMFLDSWYFLGPFDNPNRSNVHKVFGPERGVDLDATYVGKNNQTLKWEFRQSNNARIKPPHAQEYAIWYAYTELYAEKDETIWVAIGSDDQSTVYVNGSLIWQSQAVLKGWQAGEGLRQVKLHKGKNSILFRLENGWRGVDMSMGVRLK
jgi:hypothetical protein